jgi:ATP-dependent Clp protease ATP-binding subunit ClpA
VVNYLPKAMKWTIFSKFAIDAMSAQDKPGDPKLSSLDLLRSMLASSDCNAHKALSQKLQTTKLLNALEGLKSPVEGLEPAMKTVLATASSVSQDFSTEKIGTDHLLIGILKTPESLACEVLTKVGIDETVLQASIAKMAPES